MKRIITICAAILMTASVFAQAPEKMSYQAVVRDGSNNLVSSTAVGMQISILQGSASGTAVYVETQTPTSNANGLVSLEIGSGTVVSGDFTTIDWSAGPYFIKTETDPMGGTNYTITGTSQLLSVPYALHAKTAENISGGITETDPIFTAWDKDYDDLTNKPTTDGSETKLTAGTNVTVTGAGTTASPYVVNATSVTTLTIGQSYQGGIIFWIDSTGQHGLIAAISDQSTGIRWHGGTNTNTRARANGIFAGFKNTTVIIADQGPVDGNDFAATVCNEYSNTVGAITYGDWYLPSKYELNLMYLQKDVIGGFDNTYYWSSSEANIGSAWFQDFDSGVQDNDFKISLYSVRAVRAF
ncbi:MAG TPA: DUF1566 domain-containing protein [Tenuifilaceae bacterium]|nr:DUF1566 domain-containing protein [Tenuifilaceae bacterium]